MFTDIWIIAHLALYQPQNYFATEANSSVVLAQRQISMANRYSNSFVNSVFRDNILLSVHYLAGEDIKPSKIDWSKINEPFHYEFSLKQNEKFAFHEHTLKKYSNNVVKTMNSNFYWNEGYKSDGLLVGDGVCHIASLIYWTAKDAGLDAYAPSNHNFAKINEIPNEFGVSIRSPNPMGNLYITNSKDSEVRFVFNYDGENLKVVIEQNS